MTYDAGGRTTSITTSAGTTSLAYDHESRITGMTFPNSSTNSFGYNGYNTRVSKTDSIGTHTFKRAGAGVTAPVLHSTLRKEPPRIWGLFIAPMLVALTRLSSGS